MVSSTKRKCHQPYNPHLPEIRVSGRKIHELTAHSGKLTGTAWASRSNPTMTCAVDGVWKPILVLLHISWTDSCVKGSPMPNKFALSSRSQIISICYFEEENEW
uniref:Uncharacterized protein n=1 Tax=Apteryx owenii TaxID=8824 RepID=A0A8B9PDS4_APTOW